MINQYATPEGTAEYFKNHQVNQTKIRKMNNLSLSALAVGTYLGGCDQETDRLYEANLGRALESGINFFDTAINYRCQRSEKNIAYALKKAQGTGLKRDQFFISTKGGFLPAEDEPETFQNYVLKCFINTGIITPDDIVANCHCMTPKYLQSQIDLSLENLKLKTIDLYYLHNPEIQLPILGEEVFYKKLTQAFELFEKNVADGKIANYGMATWDGFRQGFAAENRLDLEKIMVCARQAGGQNHHFKAIQLPYNLAMLEAVAIPSQKIEGEDYPIVPAAVHNHLSVFVSAPLLQSNIKNLPQDLFDRMPGQGTSMQKALDFVLSSPGVTAAMVGMKSKGHLDENKGVLTTDPWDIQDLQVIASLLVRK